MEFQRRGVMLVIASPSGAGKSSISRALFGADPNIKLSVSVTTRARRTDEVRQTPLPVKPEVPAALDKAARAMDTAARSLQEKQAPEATAKQGEAPTILTQGREFDHLVKRGGRWLISQRQIMGANGVPEGWQD